MKKSNFFKKVCMALLAVALVMTSVDMSGMNVQAATKKVTLSATTKTINAGKSFTLKVTGVTGLKSSKVKFTTSNAKIATVSTSKSTTSCTVKGISKGKVTITAKSSVNSKVIAKCTVTVKQLVKSIKLSGKTKTLGTGVTKSVTLKATVSPSNANNKGVTWKSSNTKVATVSSKGTVTAKAKGTATITATAKDGSKKSAAYKITVKQTAASVSLSQTAYALTYKGKVTLKATVLPSNTSSKSVTWKSSNTSIATVDSKGRVTAKSKTGTVTITATTKDGSKKKASCKITVKDKKKLVKVTSVKMSAATATLNIGTSKKLSVSVSPSKATLKAVYWSSSNTSAATVDQKGNVKAVGAGTATITAKAQDGSGKKATCAITVVIPVSGITLNSTALSLVEGNTAALKATVAPSNATDKTVTWTSSDASVATVVNGTVTALKVGTATITATSSNGKAASCTVTVASSTVAVTGVTLTPATAIIEKDATSQLTAVVVPANATNKGVTFSSSDETVATVDNSGVVTGVKEGKAVITVTTADGAKTATTEISVISTVGVRVFDGTNYSYTLNKSASAFDVAYGDASYTATAQSVFDAIGNLQDTAAYLSGMGSMVYTETNPPATQQLEFIWNKINETTLSQYPGVATASVVDSTDTDGNRIKTVTITTVNNVVRTFELKAPATFTCKDNTRWVNITEIGGAGREVTLYGMWINVNDDGSQTIYFHIKNALTDEEPAGGELVLNISADTKNVTLGVNNGNGADNFASLQETDSAYVLTFEKSMYDKFATSFGVTRSLDDLLVSAE